MPRARALNPIPIPIPGLSVLALDFSRDRAQLYLEVSAAPSSSFISTAMAVLFTLHNVLIAK